ncbi:MAG: FtsQ-type POTRA domain-containing protein [Candidatus Daviesbacteria bacterium]|nr:FtsQ-type POTRA domain-containing protein [Candidatus Daviesbacteria bacterium]
MWRKRKSKKRFSGYVYWVIPILVVTTLVFIFFKSELLTVTQVEISSNQPSCVSETQIKDTANFSGQNFFLVNFENIKKNLKAKFICIGDINMSLVFPNKVRIEVKGRQPAAVIMSLKTPEATSSSFLETIATPSAEFSEAYLIDNEGVVFSKDTGGFNIPDIFIKDSNISLGKKAVGNNLENSLKILTGVKKLGLDVKTAAIFDNFFLLFSYPRVVFRLDDKIDMQLASLQLILTEAKIDLKELEFIDLRFDKPLVRFAPKK